MQLLFSTVRSITMIINGHNKFAIYAYIRIPENFTYIFVLFAVNIIIIKIIFIISNDIMIMNMIKPCN